jgi:hypothetical protein
MSYNLQLTNGSVLITGGLPDGSVNTTASSLALIGRNYNGYGAFLNENFIYILENFANGTPPSNPLAGQLWWDTANKILKVYTGTSWKISTGASSSSIPPLDTTPIGGDLWWDNINSQLKVWSGTSWVTIGPVATPATGNSGATPVLWTDTNGANHVVIEFLVNNVVLAVFSKDTFSTTTAGFTSVLPGLNMSTGSSPVVEIQGTITSANASNYSTNSVFSNSASYLGNYVASVTNTASTLVARDTTGNIFVNRVIGTATSALYSDLAERYAADNAYEPGTVVELGGTAEVTSVVNELSDNVFGVVSTSPAYLMNREAGNDVTHPAIAMTGRVPVKVTGFVNKGDRLVSAGNGIARTGTVNEITVWNVIGRSLENKYTDGPGLVEAVVKINL